MCQAAISCLLFLGKRLGVPVQPWCFEHKSIIPAVPCLRGIWSTSCAGSSGPAGFAAREQTSGLPGSEPSLALAALPPLPLATGAEQELLCLCQSPLDPWLFCKLSLSLWARRRLLCCCLVGRYLMEMESLSLSQEAGRGNLRPETLGSGREVMEQCSGVNAAQCAVNR